MNTESYLLFMRKAKPMFLLLLLVGSMGIAAADLYTVFISSPVSTTITVAGLDASLIQSGVWSSYTTKATATTLVPMMNGINDLVPVPGMSKSCILVVDDSNTATGLQISIDVTYSDGTLFNDWSCTPRIANFYRTGGNGVVDLKANGFTDGKGPWVITNAQIEDIKYDTTAGIEHLANTDYNGLLLGFTFPPVTYADIESGLDYGTNTMKIVVSVDMVTP